MHIVHLIARLNDGGPARVIASLAREMMARGHRITVLCGRCPPGEPDIGDVVRAAGAVVETVPGLAPRPSPVGDWRALFAVERRLRALDPDVLHTHTAKAGAIGRVVARLIGKPCLHTYHGHVLHGYFSAPVNHLLAGAERALAGFAHHHALTASQLVELRDAQRIGRRDRWHVLPVPVEPVAPRAALWQEALTPGLPVIGFLGRLAPVKDADLFLDAVALIAGRRAVQAVICGDGPLRPRLEARAMSLGLPVRFTGFVPAAEALYAFDAMLVTSRNEGQPLTVIEAAGAGVPVVAPAVGGLADLICAGLATAAPRSAAGLAEAALAAIDAPVDARRLATLAAAYAPAALASAYERLYTISAFPGTAA